MASSSASSASLDNPKLPAPGTVVSVGFEAGFYHLVGEEQRRTVCGLWLNLLSKNSIYGPGPNWKKRDGEADCPGCREGKRRYV